MNSSNDTMNALVLHGVGDARLERIPTPKPGPGEVLVRIGSCGVCGSDIPRIFEKGTYKFPTVCGHEFAGTIAAVGPGVARYSVDDRVAVYPLVWCGECPPCEQGRYAQCYDYDYLGSRSDGAFAEYVVAPERNLVRVPEGVTLEEAAMTEPAAVALHALKRAGGCKPGETVAIYGAGPIGILVAQWARSMGAERVILFDLVEEKLRLARSLDFEFSLQAYKMDCVGIVYDLTNGEGVDISVEAAGRPKPLLQALQSANRGGRVVLLGNPSDEVTISAELISQAMRKEVQILGTWNSEFSGSGDDDDWREVLKAVANKKIDLKSLITHRVGLKNALEALFMMRDGKEFYSKVLVRP